MMVLVGASASGKTELAKILKSKYKYQKCITTTTRQPRENEVNGVDYHFVSFDEFDVLREQNEFLEVTNYQNQWYGIQRKDVKLNGIVIVDPSGANHLVESLRRDVFVVYVQTDEKIRKERMIARGDLLSNIQKRILLDRDVFQIDNFVRIDFILRNETQALDNLADILHEEYQKAYQHMK